MDTENLNNLYELTRTYLSHSEAIGQGINEIKHKRLREHLIEMFKTCEADLLILNDFVFEASTCEDESDVDSLINFADEEDFEQPKFEVN